MRKTLFFILLFSLKSLVNAQYVGITGWVFDFNSLEKISGAIVLDDKSNFYSETTEQGYYQLVSKKGKREIVFAAPGYKTQKLVLDLTGSLVKNVFLKRVDFDEDDSSSEFTSLFNDKTSFYKLLPRQIKQGTSLFSINDPIKVIQYLPGVSGGIEGLSGLYVRGSNSDQNLILMNGLPLYGNGHIWGLMSNFNPEIIQSCDFYRGVAPARYGGRAGGGVLDVQTSSGSAEDWSGSVNVDVATFNVAINGPLDKQGKLTTSLAFRRSYLDWILGDQNFLVGNVHDLNFKLGYKKDIKNHFDFWVYNGRDKYGINLSANGKDSIGRRIDFTLGIGAVWQNTLAGMNYSHVINSGHYMNFSAGFSRYTYKFSNSITGNISTDTTFSTVQISDMSFSSITDYSVKADFFYMLGPESKLRYGSQFIVHDMNPNTASFYYKNSQVNKIIDTTYGLFNRKFVSEFSNYAEIEFHPNEGMSMNIGGRVWNYFSAEKNYMRFEPRFILSQQLEGKKRIQLGFSVANQGIHQLSSVSGILPQDVWFPTTGNFTPQKTTQFTIGYLKPMSNSMEFSMEYYYKDFQGITEITGVEADQLQKSYWEQTILQGTGSSQGLEFLITKKTGQLNGILSYTLSATDRRFTDLNNGETFDFRWDRRHKLNLQLVYQVSPTLTFNFAAVVMSGHAVTVPTSKYFTTDGTMVFDYSQKNNYRMPYYKRLDIGFTKEIKPEFHDDYHEYYGIYLYNFFGWDNPVIARFEKDDVGITKLMGVSYFKFVPSAFYRLQF